MIFNFDITLLDENIINQLDNLYENKIISNLLFYGNNLTGKKIYLTYLLNKVYKDNETFKKYVLSINCCHGKGNIKFIRENIKFFANTIINNKNNYIFKSIILLNADKLTIDAQSALRRSIEIYNHSTRFFIIVDNKDKILKPILSRFSDIYCKKNINNLEDKYVFKKIYSLNRIIKYDVNDLSSNELSINDLSSNELSINDLSSNELSINDLSHNVLKYDIKKTIDLSYKLYNNGFSGNLLIEYIKIKLRDNKDKYKFLFFIEIYKKKIRNEVIIILFCLNFLFNPKINIDYFKYINII